MDCFPRLNASTVRIEQIRSARARFSTRSLHKRFSNIKGARHPTEKVTSAARPARNQGKLLLSREGVTVLPVRVGCQDSGNKAALAAVQQKPWAYTMRNIMITCPTVAVVRPMTDATIRLRYRMTGFQVLKAAAWG
jgi:hypothetical protein